MPKTLAKTSTHEQKLVNPKTVSLLRKTHPEKLHCKSDF